MKYIQPMGVSDSGSFRFSWKLGIGLSLLSLLFSFFCIISVLYGQGNGGIGNGGMGIGSWIFLTLLAVLLLIMPLIYIFTKTWWSTKSVTQTIKNLFLAVFIQVMFPLLVWVGILRSQGWF
jgi:hypothetical protein